MPHAYAMHWVCGRCTRRWVAVHEGTEAREDWHPPLSVCEKCWGVPLYRARREARRERRDLTRAARLG